MQIRTQSKTGPLITGLDPVLAEIHQQLQDHPKKWLHALAQKPGALADLEQQVHHVFAQMADHVVAGLLAQATADAAFADNAKKK